jgi:hypothetical protein
MYLYCIFFKKQPPYQHTMAWNQQQSKNYYNGWFKAINETDFLLLL